MSAYPQLPYFYRVPTTLSKTEKPIKRVLLVGSCTVSLTAGVWKNYFGVDSEFIHILNLVNQADLDVSGFDLQMMSIPLEAVMPLPSYMNVPFSAIEDERNRFEEAASTLRRIIGEALLYNEMHSLPTFVCNFLVPQQNHVGRFMPRYDLRNPAFFIESLNRVIAEEIEGRTNVFLLDIDSIAATYGKKTMQDDVIWKTSHGGVLTDADFTVFEAMRHSTLQRLEPLGSFFEHSSVDPGTFWKAICAETISMFRSIHQIDSVKIVIVDLDDTLWRGIVAEETEFNAEFMLEGLHLGLIESLDILKKRGVLLAICSKNDHDKVAKAWDSLLSKTFSLSNFFTTRINWKSKSENIGEILGEANLLSKNAIFIDDNPKERAEVASAFPEIRVLGEDFYNLRRVLLWSSETQPVHITDESGRRTEMVKQQILRESERRVQSREDFLKALKVEIRASRIRSSTDQHFPRALELLNKTNQFNTTGQRYSLAEAEQIFAAGGTMYGFHVSDKFSNYGVVAVAIVKECNIDTFAMSCRVIGTDAEIGAIAVIIDDILSAGAFTLTASQIATEFNLLSRDLYERAGFSEAEGQWMKSLPGRIVRPEHIAFVDA